MKAGGQIKTRRPGAHARPKAVASLHPPSPIRCLHLHSTKYVAPMRDSDSAGGHAGAQVAPRGKPPVSLIKRENFPLLKPKAWVLQTDA